MRALIGIGALARTVGVSTQHCRDLEAGQALPPAIRTAGGHRQYTDLHVAALRAYETMAAGHGFGRARAVLSLVNAGEVDAALALVDERHAAVHRQRLETRRILEMLRSPSPDDGAAAPASAALPAEASIGEAAALLGVSGSTLRHWEAEGLVRPARDPANGYRRFGRRELRQLRVVRMLREAGYPIEQVRGVVQLLAQARPDRAVALAEQRLRELADASQAAAAGDAVLWAYIAMRGAAEVRPVGAHILYE